MASKVDGSDSSKHASVPGIVYLSRVPPFMKPEKMRHLLSSYGEVGRVFLQAEDPEAQKKRIKLGGNRKTKFTEGWVEFKDKRVAKVVASTLNNTQIGGKKRSLYYDDLWNIKYLPKFRWSHLSETIAYEKAVRDQRMRAEVSQAKRENEFYLKNVDKSKALQAIESRKRKRAEVDEEIEIPESAKRSSWTFKQRQSAASAGQKPVLADGSEGKKGCGVQRSLLAKIMGSSS